MSRPRFIEDWRLQLFYRYATVGGGGSATGARLKRWRERRRITGSAQEVYNEVVLRVILESVPAAVVMQGPRPSVRIGGDVAPQFAGEVQFCLRCFDSVGEIDDAVAEILRPQASPGWDHPEVLAALRHGEGHDCALISLPRMPFWNKSDGTKSTAEKEHIRLRAQALANGIKMPYEEKIHHAEKVISEALKRRVRWALSYSGGRDSTVLGHMLLNLGLTGIPHVSSNTRMEYPETLKMLRSWAERIHEEGMNLNVVFPKDRPNTLWKKIGVPLWSKEIAYKFRQFNRISGRSISKYVPPELHESFRKLKESGMKVTDECCYYLKKKPMKEWDIANGVHGHFTGLRCAESRARRLMWITSGSLYYVEQKALWLCNPLSFWSDADVARYLEENNLVVLKPDTPNGGSGCVTCMFGCLSRASEGVANNMQDLKTRNPKLWLAALDDWGYREPLDLLGIPYE